MGGKNKGGREIRKPKQDKKPKVTNTGVIPSTARHPAEHPPR